MSTITEASALNQQGWRAGLQAEAELSTFMTLFEGEEQDSAIQTQESPQSQRGSTLTRRFTRINQDEKPKGEGDTVLGQESTEEEFEDSLAIRYLSFDGVVKNWNWEQQLVSFDRKKEVISRLALQWAYTWERGIINQLAGNTLVNTGWTNYGGSGCNIVTAQDANHTYWCQPNSGTTATDAQVAAAPSAVLDTRVIDDLETQAASRSWYKWPISPCNTPWGPLYVLVCFGTGFQQIKENGSGSDFFTLAQAEIQGGGDYDDSPLIKGGGFIYNQTLVLRSDFCPQGITSSAAQANTRVAVFFGANAAACRFGESYTDGDHIGYSEHAQHRRLSILTDSVFGYNRTVVDGESWAAVRVVHYSSK